MLSRIARAYPKKKTIHLVMDDLSTHGKNSLTGLYGEKCGGKIREMFTTYYK